MSVRLAADGLPPLLQNIPLEYFVTAVEWLKAQPTVDPARIGVLGTSRGGELALLLMFSGKDDQLWPSDIFADRIVRRLEASGFKHPVEHYAYDEAGHGITRPYVVTSVVRQVRLHSISRRPIMPGGTPEGQARANEDSWQKLITFLDRYLRG